MVPPPRDLVEPPLERVVVDRELELDLEYEDPLERDEERVVPELL